MYTLDESVLKEILKRNFNSFVGTLCERIEELEKLNLSQAQLINLLKFDLKKDSYGAMRQIQEQVDAFSKGVSIKVKFEKPL